MFLSVQHSLSKHVEERLKLSPIWIYGGLDLSGEERPYVTVRQIFMDSESVSKGREAVRSYIYYEIGIHADSLRDLLTLQSRLHHALVFDDIKLINAETGESLGSLDVFVPNAEPEPLSDVSEHSNYHRVYFDIEVDVVYGRNKF